MRLINGACHCGNNRFTFQIPEPEGAIPVRACGCSFCQKHSRIYTSHPAGVLAARIADAALVERYRFGTETADFYICRSCGVVPFVTSTIDDAVFAVVNVNSFEGVDPADLDSSPSDFDGESVDSRLSRRQLNWIPSVTIAAADG